MQCMVTNCLAQLSAGQGSAMLAIKASLSAPGHHAVHGDQLPGPAQCWPGQCNAGLLLTSIMVTTFLTSSALASNNYLPYPAVCTRYAGPSGRTHYASSPGSTHYAGHQGPTHYPSTMLLQNGSTMLPLCWLSAVRYHLYLNHTWLTVLLKLYIAFLLKLNPKYLIKTQFCYPCTCITFVTLLYTYC